MTRAVQQVVPESVAPLKVISYRASAAHDWRCGVTDGEIVVDSSSLGWPLSLKDALATGAVPRESNVIRPKFLEYAASGVALADVQLGPVLPDPEKILCVGLNYAEHADEANLAVSEQPELFVKFASNLVADGMPIVIEPEAMKVDYEAELAVVVGQRLRGASAKDAEAAIGGYTLFNDVTDRNAQFASRQWTLGKAIDTFAPMGPYLSLPDDVGDPQALGIRTRVNGELLQDGNTGEMIRSAVELMVFLSRRMTLLPGDVICTGTPAGVGMSQSPPRYLRPGDVVEVEIDRIGSLTNPVEAEAL